MPFGNPIRGRIHLGLEALHLPWFLSLSTVAPGTLSWNPSADKPYFYDGYYYVFYRSSDVIYYKTSVDGKAWSDPITVGSVVYDWTVMGIDDKILLVRVYGGYHKARVGTIQNDHTIAWGSETDLGIYHASWNAKVNCYVTKVAGTRKMFVFTTTLRQSGVPVFNDRVYVSDDDGATWVDLGPTYDSCFGSLQWSDYIGIPFNDGNKLQEIMSPSWCVYTKGIGVWYHIGSLYRDGSTFSGDVVLNGFRNPYYLIDQAIGVFDGTYVNLFYIDNLNNLLHKRVTAGGTWQTVGTVKSGISADAGVTALYESKTGFIYIFYWEDTALRYKTWNGSVHSAENTLVKGESDIVRLTAYPNPIDSRFLLVWQNATPAIRFALFRSV